MKVAASAVLLTGTVAASHGRDLLESVPTITLAQDIDYPPYAFATETGELTGFGYDVAMGVDSMCPDLNIVVNETLWDECWSSDNGGELGELVDDGTLDGCTTYTHTAGVRDEVADFSHAILKVNKAAGLLTMLDENGKPTVNGLDDLSGKTIVDVGGWAPTADAINIVENKCTGEMYSTEYTLLVGDGNDEAMSMLRNGTADAMFVYADQAESYQCDGSVTPTWDCELWEGLGTEYAYVQTGQFGYSINGTTLALTKKGSGIAELLNPCIQVFMESREYYDLCVKYEIVDECYENSHFPAGEAAVEPFNTETDELTTDCADGYCKCPTTADDVESTQETAAGSKNVAPAASGARTSSVLPYSAVLLFVMAYWLVPH